MGTVTTISEEQQFEAAWWGDCKNTYGEETKQLVYARYMQLVLMDLGGPGPEIDLGGYSILDIGGGPCSLLLKCRNPGSLGVIDPCLFPQWVAMRYLEADINWVLEYAEDFLPNVPDRSADEVWIYNVLQHVRDPELVVRESRRCAKRIRIFEWLDLPPHDGHPHELHQDELQLWLGHVGSSGEINEGGACGRAFWGVFPSE
jgi:2-polyprenyl-3-methyl-5-hydroxy-6-metoxy-1,4-benzoquinol methylase